jgi:hypothetical protein
MFILQQNQQWLKLLLCKWLEYTGDGAYWRRDKSGVLFTHECVKRTQIENPERTRSERSGSRASARRTQSERKIFKSELRANPGANSRFPRVLGCVRSILCTLMIWLTFGITSVSSLSLAKLLFVYWAQHQFRYVVNILCARKKPSMVCWIVAFLSGFNYIGNHKSSKTILVKTQFD